MMHWTSRYTTHLLALALKWELKTHPTPPDMWPQDHPHPALAPVPSKHGISECLLALPDVSIIWWPSKEACSNLFTLGSHHRCGHLVVKTLQSAQAGGTHPTGMLYCLFFYCRDRWKNVFLEEGLMMISMST